MAERIVWSGGEPDIRLRPEAGTEVTVRILLDLEKERSGDGDKTAT